MDVRVAMGCDRPRLLQAQLSQRRGRALRQGSPNAAVLERSVWGAGLRRREVQFDSSVTAFGVRFRIQPIKGDAHFGGRHRVSAYDARVLRSV